MHKSGHLRFSLPPSSHAQVAENAARRRSRRVRQQTCHQSRRGQRGYEDDSIRLCSTSFFAGISFIAVSPSLLSPRPTRYADWIEVATDAGTRACQIPYGHAELYRKRRRLRFRAAHPGSTITEEIHDENSYCLCHPSCRHFLCCGSCEPCCGQQHPCTHACVFPW
jgi:hypothetical protein